MKYEFKQREAERDLKTKELREVKRTQERAHIQHTSLLKEIRKYTEEIDKILKEKNKETISYEAENAKWRQEIETCSDLIEEKEERLKELRFNRDKNLSEMNEYKATQQKVQRSTKQYEQELSE